MHFRKNFSGNDLCTIAYGCHWVRHEHLWLGVWKIDHKQEDCWKWILRTIWIFSCFSLLYFLCRLQSHFLCMYFIYFLCVIWKTQNIIWRIICKFHLWTAIDKLHFAVSKNIGQMKTTSYHSGLSAALSLMLFCDLNENLYQVYTFIAIKAFGHCGL